jgi:hypothetical protein
MDKIWKIISSTELGGGGPPLKEFFVDNAGSRRQLRT